MTSPLMVPISLRKTNMILLNFNVYISNIYFESSLDDLIN